MEMDIYEKSSLESTISNLIMLKAFHDVGVDVYALGIKDYTVEVHYGSDCSIDILEGGCSKLFDEAKLLNFYDLNDEEDNYNHLFEDGTPEYAILIKDSRITKINASPFKDDFSKFILKQDKESTYSESSIYLNSKENLLMIEIHFCGMLHEIAVAISHILTKAKELIIKLEEQKEDGISHQIDRKAA